MDFALRNCKRIAASLEISVTKVTDAAWDAFCKVAAIRIDDSALANELLRDAMQFVEQCRETGQPWKLKEIRDLQRRRRELQEFADEVAAEEAPRLPAPSRLPARFLPVKPARG